MKKLYLIAPLVIAAFILVYAILPPFEKPSVDTVRIPKGATVQEAAGILKDVGALRHETPFVILIRLTSPNGVHEGSYALKGPENVLSLANRFANGISGIDAIKVTIPEGFSNREIAERLTDLMPDFNTARFLEISVKDEGYLFPDTYFFMPGASAEHVVRTMRNAFIAKIEPYEAEIEASGRDLHEIVTMASLLEEEARLPETRKIVAGILWDRLELGMPLQVDAVFAYIHGISGYTPTAVDLKMDSAYNTYTNRGLPPSPISNPGLSAIEDALRPTETEYLYYLTGKDGTMHYAKTFAEHVDNRKYLR